MNSSTDREGIAAQEEPQWHAEFLSRVLPTVRRVAGIRFRRWRAFDREDAIAHAIAAALVAYLRLRARGKNPASFPCQLADFAIRHVHSGRRIGCRDNSRDVASLQCQRKGLFSVQPLSDLASDWQSLLLVDRGGSSPAEIASLRIDFGAWLQQLSPRNRIIANCLAAGDRTTDVARRFRLSPSRISQLRREFAQSWFAFRDADKAADAGSPERHSGLCDSPATDNSTLY